MISPKDLVALYGAHITIDFTDLVKIMEFQNSKKDGSGCLNYPDFSKWVGNEIHNLASFIFRHDSKRNPPQEKYMKLYEQNKAKDKAIAAKSLITDENVLKNLIHKITHQWGTVRKAFKGFNEDNDSYIDKEEFIFFLEHWGYPLSDNQGDIVFKYFDKDGDGKISYNDFVTSIGFDIHPAETLYFR